MLRSGCLRGRVQASVYLCLSVFLFSSSLCTGDNGITFFTEQISFLQYSPRLLSRCTSGLGPPPRISGARVLIFVHYLQLASCHSTTTAVRREGRRLNDFAKSPSCPVNVAFCCTRVVPSARLVQRADAGSARHAYIRTCILQTSLFLLVL